MESLPRTILITIAVTVSEAPAAEQVHAEPVKPVAAPVPPVPYGAPMCSEPGCERTLTQRQNQLSRKSCGKPFCEAHEKSGQQALAHRLAAHPAL